MARYWRWRGIRAKLRFAFAFGAFGRGVKAITSMVADAEEFLGVANGRLKFSARKASNGEPHPVEGRRHVGRTKRRQRRVIEIDMEVGQHRAARFQTLDPFERLADREMRTVPLVAQRVDDPQIETFEILNALGRDRVEIGRIGNVAEAEAKRGNFTMFKLKWNGIQGSARSI